MTAAPNRPAVGSSPLALRLCVLLIGTAMLVPVAHGCHGADEDTEPGVVVPRCDRPPAELD
jgi:hypothetical protein